MKRSILKQEKNENENRTPTKIARGLFGLGILAFAGLVVGAGMAITGNVTGAEPLLKNGLTVLTISGITAAASFIGTAAYSVCAVAGYADQMEEKVLLSKREAEKNEELVVEPKGGMVDFSADLEK